jgi:hypothetical protein
MRDIPLPTHLIKKDHETIEGLGNRLASEVKLAGKEYEISKE